MDWLKEQMRYVHLDFHTPKGVNVADGFDEEEFLQTLRKTRADSIAIFAEEYLFPQIREVLETYDVDGLLLDIVFFREGACFCSYCQEGMKKQELNTFNEEEHLLFNDSSLEKFLARTYDLAKDIKPQVAVTFDNLVKIGARDYLPYLDYWWIESLPYGWRLYYLPVYARYLRTLGKPIAGLTARFQKSWGDFGSLKPLQHLL